MTKGTIKDYTRGNHINHIILESKVMIKDERLPKRSKEDTLQKVIF